MMNRFLSFGAALAMMGGATHASAQSYLTVTPEFIAGLASYTMPLSNDRLTQLQGIAHVCAADVSAVPQYDLCGAVTEVLTRHFGNYQAYRQAMASYVPPKP